MNLLMLTARIVETVILSSILFVILTQMGDHIFFGFVAILACFYGAEWLRNRIVRKLAERRKQGSRDKHPTA